MLYQLACYYALAGDREQAIDHRTGLRRLDEAEGVAGGGPGSRLDPRRPPLRGGGRPEPMRSGKAVGFRRGGGMIPRPLRSRRTDRFTVDKVATWAGCGKATIYRRWRSRGALRWTPGTIGWSLTVADPDTGSVRDDLVAMLGELARKMRGHWPASLMPAVGLKQRSTRDA